MPGLEKEQGLVGALSAQLSAVEASRVRAEKAGDGASYDSLEDACGAFVDKLREATSAVAASYVQFSDPYKKQIDAKVEVAVQARVEKHPLLQFVAVPTLSRKEKMFDIARKSALKMAIQHNENLKKAWPAFEAQAREEILSDSTLMLSLEGQAIGEVLGDSGSQAELLRSYQALNTTLEGLQARVSVIQAWIRDNDPDGDDEDYS